MFLPAYAVENGVPKNLVAALLGVVGLSDLIGRILGGWFADLGKRLKFFISLYISLSILFLFHTHVSVLIHLPFVTVCSNDIMVPYIVMISCY